MLDALDHRFLDNPVRNWLLAAIAAALTLASLMLLRRVLVDRLGRRAASTPTFADDALLDVARRTRIYFFIAIAVAVGTRALVLSAGVRHVIGRALILVVLLQLGRWVSHLIDVWIARFTEQRTIAGDVGSITTVRALGVAARLLFWLVIGITVLEAVFEYDVTALVTGLGIVGIAVALAVQNVLGDLLAALSIVLDKPFVVGDYIVVGDKAGTVETIGLKTTRLRALGGEQLIFSNAELLKSTIHNYKRMYERRVAVSFEVHLQTARETLERIPAAVRAIAEAASPVRVDRCHVAGWNDRGFRIELVYYMLDPAFNTHMDVQQRIHFGILAWLETNEVRLARTLLEEKIVAD